MRQKAKYNSLHLIHLAADDVETPFDADEIDSNRKTLNALGMWVKDSNSRYITDSDIDFKIDDVIILPDGTKKRITELPSLKPTGSSNMRRGYCRYDKILVTT